MDVLSMDRRLFIATCVSSTLAVTTLPLIASSKKQPPLAVIVASDSPVSELSMAELHRVFGGDSRRDEEGNKLIPFNHPPKSSGRVAFDSTVLKMDPDEVSKYWIDRKIRGQSGPPRTIDSLKLLRRIVAKLPGAISYLPPQYVDGTLKVVRIEGKRPDEPGYPIR